LSEAPEEREEVNGSSVSTSRASIPSVQVLQDRILESTSCSILAQELWAETKRDVELTRNIERLEAEVREMKELHRKALTSQAQRRWALAILLDPGGGPHQRSDAFLTAIDAAVKRVGQQKDKEDR
jgi:hypothetical protein